MDPELKNSKYSGGGGESEFAGMMVHLQKNIQKAIFLFTIGLYFIYLQFPSLWKKPSHSTMERTHISFL